MTVTQKRFRLPPKRTALMKFTGDLEGMEIEVRLDVPVGLFLDIQSMVEEGKAVQIFQRFAGDVLIAWNLEDETGQPVPATVAGMLSLPLAQANIIIQKWAEVVQGLSNPLGGASLNGGQSEPVPSGTMAP